MVISSRQKGKLSLIAVVFGLLLGVAAPVQADNAGRYDLAAHITYLLGKYSSWPSDPSSGGEILVGVYGGGSAEKSFTALNGKTLKGGKIRVVAVSAASPPSDVQKCAILFTSKSSDLDKADSATAGKPVLLVHYGNGNGTACVSLFENSGKIAFDVSMGPLNSRKLRMSSQALKLATNVYK